MKSTSFDTKEENQKGIWVIDLLCGFMRHHYNFHLVAVTIVDDGQCFMAFTPFSRTQRNENGIAGNYWNEWLEGTFKDKTVRTAFINLMEKVTRSETDLIPMFEQGGDRGVCLFFFPTDGKVAQNAPLRRKGCIKHTDAESSIVHLIQGRVAAEQVDKTKWDGQDSDIVTEWKKWVEKAMNPPEPTPAENQAAGPG